MSFEEDMGLELRWLERTPDKREVDGSNPFRPTKGLLVKASDLMGEVLYIENYIMKNEDNDKYREKKR